MRPLRVGDGTEQDLREQRISEVIEDLASGV